MGITERIYKKIEKHAVKICFVLAVLLASLITTGVYYRAEAAARGELQEHLAQEVLRFHVLANSDSDGDQELKLEVRDAKGRVGARVAFVEPDTPRLVQFKRIGETRCIRSSTLMRDGQPVVQPLVIITVFGPDFVSHASLQLYLPDFSTGIVGERI